MNIGANIKKLREKKGVKQQEIAELINMHRSNYSKIENGQREIAVIALNKIANFFGITVDELINMDQDISAEIQVEDKSTLEQVKLIQELESDDKAMIFRMIDTLISKKKLKDFFNKQFAT